MHVIKGKGLVYAETIDSWSDGISGNDGDNECGECGGDTEVGECAAGSGGQDSRGTLGGVGYAGGNGLVDADALYRRGQAVWNMGS